MSEDFFDEEENEFELDEDGLLDRGEMTLKGLNHANVPVDIWFDEINRDEDEEEADLYDAGFRYRLLCANYMPRKCRVNDTAVKVYAKDKITLQKAFAKYILPLYQLALNKVTQIAAEGNGNLYYWDSE